MLLTIDIGTSNFKSAIWDFNGNRVAYAAVPLSISLSDGPRHEADSDQWVKAFQDCVLRLAAEVSVTDVLAVVISGNGPSLIPVLGKATGLHLPAAPARLWLDRRAPLAAEQISVLMGGFVDACFFLPKALDIKINEPRLYEQTFFFLGCPELLAFALTGAARTIFPADGFERWFWNDSVLDRLGLDREKFPPFIRPGETFGGLIPRIAADLGLSPDIPVISGGPDFFAAILGAGVVKPGQACDRAGTSEGINACTENQMNDERLMSYRHPVAPFWNLSGIVSTTGKAIDWGCNLLGITYDDFFMLAEKAQAGAGGLVFVPYLAGERAPMRNPKAQGLLRGLSLSSGRPEFARSIMEGIGFAIRDIIGAMEEAGATVNELRVTGSLSYHDRLNQIKADITQKPLLVPHHKEAELLGLAIIGSHALGKFSSVGEAASVLARIERTLWPDEKTAALYGELFAEYKDYRN